MTGSRRFALRHLIAIALVGTAWPVARCEARTFLAYSLKAARASCEREGPTTAAVANLGGITIVLAMVSDPDRQDLILVGEVDPGKPRITLNDLVTALRGPLVHRQLPLVSIDWTQETDRSGRQRVRFEGGIAGTAYGDAFLRCDAILKKIGLGLLSAGTPNVWSYFDLAANGWVRTGVEDTVHSRFWFVLSQSSRTAVREGVVVIKQARLDVKTEALGAASGSVTLADEAGDRFAACLARHLDEVSNRYPELKQLDPLLRLAGLAEGIEDLQKKDAVAPDLDYWLHEYKTAGVETPKEFPVLRRTAIVRRGASARTLTVDGGIEMRALLAELRDGDAVALREVVIRSRPAGNPLLWQVPLAGWPAAGTSPAEKLSPALGAAPWIGGPEIPGCMFRRQFGVITPGVSGVDMWMRPAEESFRQDPSGAIEKRGKTVLESRPRRDSLYWDAEKKEDSE